MNTQRSISIYRHLSALYPKAFRAEYGDDLIATFTEHLRDERAARVWLPTIRDLVVTVPSQHLEAKMNRPAPETVAMIAASVTVAALVLAVVAGTSPVVAGFLLGAVAALVVATLAWKAARPGDRNGAGLAGRWRTLSP